MSIIADHPAPTRLRPKHLTRLEAESIGVMREVVAEFRNPVMLYSIGKDSSVMLHLARKAFFPAKPPFPLLHIDTLWKPARARSPCPHQRGGAGARHQPDHLGVGAAHDDNENRSPEAGARQPRV